MAKTTIPKTARTKVPSGAKCARCGTKKDLKAFRSVCYGSSEMKYLFHFRANPDRYGAGPDDPALRIFYSALYGSERALGNSTQCYRMNWRLDRKAAVIYRRPRIWVFCTNRAFGFFVPNAQK